MQPLPNQSSPLASIQNGTIQKPWDQFLQQFVQAPPPFVTIPVTTPSQFNYTAVEPGFVYIFGGAVINIALFRGQEALDVTTVRIIPVSIGDTVAFNYSVAPIVKFIPIYGAAPK